MPWELCLAVIVGCVLATGAASPTPGVDAEEVLPEAASKVYPQYEYAGEWGDPNPIAGFIHNISAVAVGPNGNVYVAEEFDVAKDQIQVFDRAGEFSHAWGERPYPGRTVAVSTEADLLGPHEIAVAPDGTAYVAVLHGLIKRFSPDGEQLGSWALPEVDDDTFYPQDMAVAPDGTVYVVGSEYVQYFSPEGRFLGEWGKERWPGEEGAFWLDGVAVAPDGTVYVSGNTDGNVARFTPDGSYLGTIDVEWALDMACAPDGTIYASQGGRGYVVAVSREGGELRRWTVGCTWGIEPDPVHDIAAGPDGTVYVANGFRNSVQCFTPEGELLREIGSPTPPLGCFHEPHGIATSADGKVWVADSYNRRVQCFTAEGEPLGQVNDGITPLGSPVGVGVSREGIVSVGISDPSRMAREYATTRYTPEGYLTGKWFWEDNPGDSYIGMMGGLEVTPGDAIYVTDSTNNRIYRFSPRGDILETWGREGTGPGEFDGPEGIAVRCTEEGEVTAIYVVDQSNSRVQYFAPGGRYLGEWGEGGDGAGQFFNPAGIAVGPDGTVFVVDGCNHRVQYFTADGGFLGVLGREGLGEAEFKFPVDVAVAPDGTLYVTDGGNDRVQYFRRTEGE
jgi:DNA-binding beta-propeller fold protein YncE